tara:strand:+ start:6470 stop:7036 length:567 start_codon:yes stop_codon:yes gene_type:complete
MRSACSGKAVYLVEMDVKGTSFTIRDLEEVEGPGQVVLCEVHIGRLKAPKGWQLIDERNRGNLVQFPEDPENRPKRRKRGVLSALKRENSDETVRPIGQARHPLETEDSGPSKTPSPEKTPMLARAFTGLGKHPSLPQSESVEEIDEMNEHDAFDEEVWDQRDSSEVEEERRDGDQMDFDSIDLEPIA